MPMQTLKTTIVQLERKRNKRRLALRKLQEEHDQLLLHSKAIDLLVQHQDAVARVLHVYYGACCSPPPSIGDDTGLLRPLLFQDWPLMAGLTAMQLSDYNWLLEATPQQVGACIFHHLQRIAAVVNRLKASSSSSSSGQQQADMDKAVGELLFLTKAIYLLTPGTMIALKDVNLLTGQLEPPPDSHWERAFCATEASLEQLAVMEEILQQVVPRMQQLEEEREGLAACINSVKAFTLKEQSAATQQLVQLVQQQHEQEEQQQQQQLQQQEQQQRQQQQQARGRVGASRAAGLREAAVQQVAAVTAAAAAAASAIAWDKEEQPEPHAWPNGWHHSSASADSATKQEPAATNGFHTSLLQQTLEAACPTASPQAAATAAAETAAAQNGCNGKSEGSETNHYASASQCISISASALCYMRGNCKDMIADMDGCLLKWRTLSGARSAVTFVLRPEQLAAMVLASFPCFPMMGNLCDHLPAARAAAEQRQQQQTGL